MNVITCRLGPRRGLWFKTEAGLDAFRGHADVRTAEARGSPGLMLLGFPCRVATAAEWMELETGVARENAIQAHVAEGRRR